jgi:hypothetical protein
MPNNEGASSIIRSTVAFYAATVGFGLKNLLDLKSADNPTIFPYRWACFAIVALLAFRFLTGSSGFLATRYARIDDSGLGKAWIRFSIDILFLLVLGFLAILGAYSANITGFLAWCFWMCAASLMWTLMALFSKTDREDCWFFVIPDVLATVLLGCAYLARSATPHLLFNWPPAITLGLLGSLVSVVFELPWQVYRAK